MHKIRIAFIKYNGLAAGGTERWLQEVAISLPRDEFEVCYFYTGEPDFHRKEYLKRHGVDLVYVKASGKSLTGEWLDTDFFDKFDEQHFDMIQTAIAGPCEWPYFLFKKPVLQKVALDMGVDFRSNVYHTFFMSRWLRRQWILKGGSLCFSSVIPFGVTSVVFDGDLRQELGIPQNALVAGFHQRVDDDTFSPVPLESFAEVSTADNYFIIMGGSSRYREQAKSLGLKNFCHISHSSDGSRISSFLNTLDIFAQGRRDGETFGYVFAEALMHKKPCLGHAAECNAHKDTMGPGGLWATTPEEYITHLRSLFDDGELRQRLAAEGYSHACATFNNVNGMSLMARKYREIYNIGGWKRLLIVFSRINRVILKLVGFYALINFAFRVRRKSLYLRRKFH